MPISHEVRHTCTIFSCVKVSIESVVEGLVSRYENHFSPARQPNEDSSLNEMIIAENGPLLQYADNILEKAMNQYWKENTATGKWHFIRNTEYIRTYTGGASKVLGKLLDKKSKLSFM